MITSSRKSTAPFSIGDLVKVTTKDLKENKLQTPFQGVIISMRGEGASKTFTVRKSSAGSVQVEKIYPLFSPIIDNIKVIKKGNVRQAKLYYLRKKK